MLIEKVNNGTYSQCRIPGFVITEKGTLVAYYECRIRGYCHTKRQGLHSVRKGLYPRRTVFQKDRPVTKKRAFRPAKSSFVLSVFPGIFPVLLTGHHDPSDKRRLGGHSVFIGVPEIVVEHQNLVIRYLFPKCIGIAVRMSVFAFVVASALSSLPGKCFSDYRDRLTPGLSVIRTVFYVDSRPAVDQNKHLSKGDDMRCHAGISNCFRF